MSVAHVLSCPPAPAGKVRKQSARHPRVLFVSSRNSRLSGRAAAATEITQLAPESGLTGATGGSLARAGDASSSKAAESVSRGLPSPATANAASSTSSSGAAAANAASSPTAEAVPSTGPPDLPQSAGDSPSVLDTLSSSVNDATQNLLDKAADVKASASQSLEGASGDLKDQLDAVSGLASDALQQTTMQLTNAREVASDYAASLSGQLTGSATSAIDGLPTPVRDAIYAAAAQATKALADPRVSRVAAGVAVAVPSFLWLRGRFGGYAGLLKAEKALELLERENSVLIDIRSDDRRSSYGTPELRFGARARGVALPLLGVSRRSGTQVVKADVLPYRLAALLVQGLSKVNSRTKVIVLDDSEQRAIKMARAVSAETRLRAYALQGGFKGWVSAGLPLKESTEYEGTALEGFADTLQGRLIPSLRRPEVAISYVALPVLAGASLYDIHKTLQFIGTYALLATIATAPVRYSSKEEAYEQLFGPFTRVAGLVGNFLPKSRPGSAAAEPATVSATPVDAELMGEDEVGYSTHKDEESKEAKTETKDSEIEAANSKA